MKETLCKWLLRLFGWSIGPVSENVPKCVICIAPHTSNLDFILGQLYYTAIGRKAHFLMKKEWFVFPLNLIFKKMGGFPVDRKKNNSVTDQMVKLFEKYKYLHLAITPEGTRKKVDEWKKGFYYIALKAQVPIQLAYIDYRKKEMGFKGTFYPTNNPEEDMLTIRSYYQEMKGRYRNK
ncbi:MAG: lysophospholipid acyltransferase family protein [Tannerella sp.]|jgi:1-acyl-sn-glycerol-3-phosphate acyltransferase|nr:lysophospholipid acyltransferase family protein [Tannerella sp.]